MSAMPVAVVRSAKRRKTVSARMVDGVLQVRIPSWMSATEEAEHVSEMIGRFERKARSDAVDLEARARQLARRYDLPLPTSVRWVDNQTSRWGSCTPVDGTIRISSRLAPWPRWVLDYVLVHELAHLAVPSHGPAFHELVSRYPLVERATGFLIAKGITADE
jgi:predicted metal-dependent hydrolase